MRHESGGEAGGAPAGPGPADGAPRGPAPEAAGDAVTAGWYVRFYGSFLLGLVLNPRFVVQILLQTGGQLVAVIRWLARPARRRARPAVLALPFDGSWTVHRGGVTRADSHSWSAVAQRFAYDFVRVDERGARRRGDRDGLQAWLSFGEPVRAPADGVVVAARDGCRDHPRPGSGAIDWRTPDIRGNFVVLHHDGGLYSLVAHLRRGTVRVRRGDTVRRGDLLGACGNSGHSTEPHIHFHVQDHPDFFLGVGRPVAFALESAAGATEVAYLGPNAVARPAPVPPDASAPAPAPPVEIGARELVESLANFVFVAFGAVSVVRGWSAVLLAAYRALRAAVG